jgi:hypothetical protein
MPKGHLDYSGYILRFFLYLSSTTYSNTQRGHRGRDRMVVGCTTTYAISAYHH